LPRFIVMLRPFGERLRFHADLGYEYDFRFDELRRLVWNGGMSIAVPGWTFDFGVGGSKFNSSIRLTPESGIAVGNGSGASATTYRRIAGDNELGDNYVDLLFGVKVRITHASVLGGSVSVPANNQGFRADAIGTLAYEYYF